MSSEAFQLSALHPALGYGDSQFTGFASDLGWGVGEVPDAIDLFSPKSGRTITFIRARRDSTLTRARGISRNDHSSFFYKPSPLTTPKQFLHLSIMIFND